MLARFAIRHLKVLEARFSSTLAQSVPLTDVETKSSSNLQPVFRKMLPSELRIMTERALREDWHIGLNDFEIFHRLDPRNFAAVEINGEFAWHQYVLSFPGHHYHAGGVIFSEKYRALGLYEECIAHMARNYTENTLGGDVWFSEGMAEIHTKLGGEKAWELHAAQFELGKMATLESPMECDIESIDEENLQAVIGYDAVVFGTERGGFVRDWLSSPGAMGWLALDGNQTVIGYTAVRLVLRNRGTSIGLALAPLMADNSLVARALIQHAGRECLANKAVPKTSVDLFHPLNLSQGAGEILTELDAKTIHIADRYYSQGIPAGRQVDKIFGIATPGCD